MAEENKSDIKEEVKKKVEESKSAVKKTTHKEKKGEPKVELEREYIVPLKKGSLNVPKYRRAKKAVKTLKEFLAKHMKVRDRDLNKIKIDINLNNELWFRGIKKPANKIKVKARKIGEFVYVELAEIPKTVQYKIKRQEKIKAASVKAPKAKPQKNDDDKDKDGVSDKLEEKEGAKATAETNANIEKATTQAEKHSTSGAHSKNTAPIIKNPGKGF